MSCPAHAAFQDRRHAQLPRDLAHRLVAALVAHDRGPGDDLHVLDLRELGEDVLRHPVREVGVVGIGAQVLEGKNGDRFGGDLGRKRWRRLVSAPRPEGHRRQKQKAARRGRCHCTPSARPGPPRLAERHDQLTARRPAVSRILGQATAHQSIETGRGLRLNPRKGRRFALQNGGDQPRLARRLEGLAAADHLVQDDAEGEDVGARVDRLAF